MWRCMEEKKEQNKTSPRDKKAEVRRAFLKTFQIPDAVVQVNSKVNLLLYRISINRVSVSPHPH